MSGDVFRALEAVEPCGLTQDPPTLLVIGNAQGLVKGFKSFLLTETKSDPSTKAWEAT